jgi:hypothetical protein
MTGIAGCCARATSGQAAAAPPSSVTNSQPFQLTKLHALTPAKVTAYWIGEHQVRGLPPCGISVRPMTVQGQSEPKGAAKYNRFRAGMAGKQTRNQCMMFRNSWQGSAKADPSPLALFGRPSFVDPN